LSALFFLLFLQVADNLAPACDELAMHKLHGRQHSSRDRASALHQWLKRIIARIRLFQQSIDHFIPRPEIIPFVWQDDIDRSKRA
jgi:hypothetical protein